MTNSTLTNPSAQAFALQFVFQRRAQLLQMIYEKQLAIEHYVPEVKETFIAGIGASTFHAQYRHFSYFIAPLRDRLFEGRYTDTDAAEGLNKCLEQIMVQLNDFHNGKAPNIEANNEAARLARSYEECAKFLSLIYQEGVAITDYIPKIKIRPDEKTGNTYYSVSYRHKYLSPKEEKNKLFIFESSAANPNVSIADCMRQVIDELKKIQG